jgi:hypothetical protein
MRYEGGWIQWRYRDQYPEDDWKDLVEIDLDVDIPEAYDYWQLSVEQGESKDSISVYDKDEVLLRAHGGIRLFLELLNKRLHIIGSRVEMRYEGGWIQYRTVWDYDDVDYDFDLGDEDEWIDLVEITIPADGRTPEFREYDGWVEWKYTDEVEWTPLFLIPDIDADFSEGRTPEFRAYEGWVEWKYTDEEEWTQLFEIPEGADIDCDCRTAEFRYHEGWVEWKYTDEVEWTQLYEVPDFDGDFEGGTEITNFEVEVAAGTPPVVDDNDTLRVRITESNASTHDIYLGGHAALKFWHGDHDQYDLIDPKDSNTIYYINEPTE